MRTTKRKWTGWIGIVDGRPFVESISDDYCEATEQVKRVEVFTSRAQAKRRFETILRVELELRPLTRRGRRKVTSS